MPVRTVRTALGVLAGILGIIHLALTPLAYADWTIEALWFVGTGLAIIVAAAANLLANEVPSLGRRFVLAGINVVMSCFFAAAWPVLPGPQVLLGGMLFLCLALCAMPSRIDKPKVT